MNGKLPSNQERVI